MTSNLRAFDESYRTAGGIGTVTSNGLCARVVATTYGVLTRGRPGGGAVMVSQSYAAVGFELPGCR
ncbi:hypothetical protein ALI144C_00725 [Actinosynnema sp. ALI-1.44]|uniref:hypothetical protein n=1 Tax=Actinosynnema sp. ALI-1.44 TaxID=1933779 RepID=UPI00097CB4A3|nr:hypothetical protein [Actinosynnema sp. ALI-1.44]ONI91627.1 hypothetical protein ALI144C_00725 [Actinosynnema sp. ALI-1.44]